MTVAEWPTDGYAISIARISDEVQRSIPEQHEMNEAAARRLGLQIPADGFYSDVISRSQDRRPGLDAAMERITAPLCVALIATWTDRMFGSVEQTWSAYRRLTRHGVRVFDAEGRESDVRTHEGRFTGTVQGWQAEGEVIKIRRRVGDTHRTKAQHGRLLSRPPLGIRVVHILELPCKGACIEGGRGCPTRHSEVSDKLKNVWIVDEAGLAIVRTIFEEVAKGTTLMNVERMLEAHGVRSPERIVKRGRRKGARAGGTAYSKAVLYRIIRYRFYRGEMEWNRIRVHRDGPDKWLEKQPDDERIIRQHALGPLVPVELWEEANQQLDGRRKQKPERTYPPQLFDGLVYCGRCGWRMALRRRSHRLKDGTRTERYDYACHGVYIRYSTCTKAHAIPAHYLLPALAGDLSTLRRTPSGFEVTYTEGHGEAEREAQMQRLRDEIQGAELEIERIGDAVQKGLWGVEEGLRRKAGVKQRLAEAQLSLQAAINVKPAKVFTGTPAELQELAPTLADELIPLEERRRSLLRLVSRVVVDRPSVIVHTRAKDLSANGLQP